jgi:hypothetical protein
MTSPELQNLEEVATLEITLKRRLPFNFSAGGK